MRSLEESRSRWAVTTDFSSLDQLKTHVRSESDRSYNGVNAGLRSVYWKSLWVPALKESRGAYVSLRDHYMRYVERPEEIGSALDPLDDDKNSPWNTLRQDEELRAEILQDVERCMPEEPYFREVETQRLLLDVLFVFCKMNQDTGYRQGMHELLAPILWAVEKDAVPITNSPESSDDAMIETLSSKYIEHDAFTLFASVMRVAKSFYELGTPSKKSEDSTRHSAQYGTAPIVDRSKKIHEELLAHFDPELATHLTMIEILPQIFLIRWIRLLFGREFPFDQLLVLWDSIFSDDPDLDLVDLLCVSMLLRIRWQLLAADYSVALTLLLKYPTPPQPHGPQSFVGDAIYLRHHFTQEGGISIIQKYSGKVPDRGVSNIRPSTPTRSFSPEQRLSQRRSPLPSPASFLKQQRGVEALLQGAAKGVFERGERLGINQAVRDAVGEVKKNIQGLAPAVNLDSPDSRWSLDDGRHVASPRKTIAALERRNRQLASMLSDVMKELRSTVVSGDQQTSSIIDVAIAKIQCVKIYLQDSSMPLPPPEPEGKADAGAPSKTVETPRTTDTEAPKSNKPTLQIEEEPAKRSVTKQAPPAESTVASKGGHVHSPPPQAAEVTTIDAKAPASLSSSPIIPAPVQPGQVRRPAAVVPTRSSLAQSSFAFMLEPDDQAPSPLRSSSPPKGLSPFSASGRRPGVGASREKAAFLFGDEPDDLDDLDIRPRHNSIPAEVQDGFSMEAMKHTKRT